ncbi:glycosyltransferase family 2 protein [Luteimonas terricola]|uniref:Glycosyl transferase n=1 Tax=Luteimonas terricola TaxID=645597 RepID=A0ABQ2EEI0_9GAMM|nr:glycosyltransferase family 2 protein [Luteimonas terricola]GGK09130.1 glycosyl transferase [Luteimonas terricola]
MIAIVVFWVVALLLGYTYVGYPALVLALARVRPRPVLRGDTQPAVTVVMTVHNGAGELAAKLDNLSSLDYPRGRLDIVVACDGCSDASAAIARAYVGRAVTVLEYAERRGKAACLNDAVAAATGELLLMVDVRQRVEADALRRLVSCLDDPTVGVAAGELRFENPETGFAASVDAYWKYEKVIRLAESASGSAIGVSGALYAVRRRLFPMVPAGTVLDDVFVPMQVLRAGHRVVMEEGAVAWDRPSHDSTQERGRKLRTLAGNFQLVSLAPWLLVPGVNPAWLRFVSHKLLRLLSPWLLLAFAVASASLAGRHGIYQLAAAGLALFAMLVVLARIVPPMARLLPVRVASAFAHMNVYAAQAFFTWIGNRRLHLW